VGGRRRWKPTLTGAGFSSFDLFIMEGVKQMSCDPKKDYDPDNCPESCHDAHACMIVWSGGNNKPIPNKEKEQ